MPTDTDEGSALSCRFILTGVALESDDLLVAAVGERAQQRLRRQIHLILLLQRHGRVHADVAALARVGDTYRQQGDGPGTQRRDAYQQPAAHLALRVTQMLYSFSSSIFVSIDNQRTVSYILSAPAALPADPGRKRPAASSCRQRRYAWCTDMA